MPPMTTSCPRWRLEAASAVGFVSRLVTRDHGFSERLSWVFAAEGPTRRGGPFASDRTNFLEPGLPRPRGSDL